MADSPEGDVSQAQFTIAYDGPSLRDGVMDVRDLAPALLAVGKLFDAANQTINGNAATVSVRVRATVPGSFEILIDLAQTITRHLTDLFAGDRATAAANLIAIVTAGGTSGIGLISLIKWLRNRNPDNIQRLPSGMIQLSIDGETLEVPLELMRLYQSLAVRIAAQQLIEEPLKKPEIESFEVREDGHVVISVNKDESSYFAASVIPDEFVNEDVWRMAFSIISLAFKEDNKWRLYDGNTQISATIEDGEFLARVEASLESFSKGDMLVCDVKMTQTRTSGGLKTEYVVVRVVEHRPAARQIGFFTEDESGGSEPDGGDE